MDKGQPIPTLCTFLLLVLLTPVSPQCKMAIPDDCKLAYPVPGHTWIGLGFDIVKMQSTRGMVVDVEVLKEANGSCTLCPGAELHRNPDQIRPLSVTAWNITAECQPELSAALVHSVHNLAMTNAQMVHGTWQELGLPDHKGWHPDMDIIYRGSHSESIMFARQENLKDRNQFFRHEIVCKKYSFQLKQNPNVSADFQANVDALPATFDRASESQYFNLIKTYGTHYVTEGDLGGRLMSVTASRFCEIALKEFTVSEVFHCLTNQIRTAIGDRNILTADRCREIRQIARVGWLCRTFSQGGSLFGTLCPEKNALEQYKRWLGSLSAHPGLIRYTLRPISNLVNVQNPQRQSLEQAIKAYIDKRRLTITCTANTCPSPSVPSFTAQAARDCACQCRTDGYITNRDCCSKQLGLGYLHVWVIRAFDLHSDWFSKADVGVDVEFNGIKKGTGFRWNTNNPVFDNYFEFGIMQLMDNVNLRVTVKEWNPFPWGVVTIGECETNLGAGPVQDKICPLKRGYLIYRYQAVCGPYLTGHNCKDYAVQTPQYSSVLGDW